MAYRSKNMNYIFNVEYFEGLNWSGDNEKLLNEHNRAIEQFGFKDSSPAEAWKELPGYQSFALFTLYPGLLIGTGNEHSLKMNGAIKCGFSFDYITGLPYVPGSSLKGLLRAYFPGDGKTAELSEEYADYIKDILGREDMDVLKFKENIFENSDVFLGAFPAAAQDDRKMMQMEFITPHKEGPFKNPIPISQIKVKPNVQFEFCFLLNDYVPEDGGRTVTAAEKLALFKNIILDMGVGAKTNVGFGRFGEKKIPYVPGQQVGGTGQSAGSRTGSYKGGSDGQPAPECKTPGCHNKVKMNKKTGKWYPYCFECNNKRNSGRRF